MSGSKPPANDCAAIIRYIQRCGGIWRIIRVYWSNATICGSVRPSPRSKIRGKSSNVKEIRDMNTGRQKKGQQLPYMIRSRKAVRTTIIFGKYRVRLHFVSLNWTHNEMKYYSVVLGVVLDITIFSIGNTCFLFFCIF